MNESVRPFAHGAVPLRRSARRATALALTALVALAAAPTGAEVVGEEVAYAEDGVEFRGYLAYDDAVAGPRPGVLIVHEWWGHDAYVRRRALELASLGYTALAVDMYGDGKTAGHPDDAGSFASEVMQRADHGAARFRAAMEVLRGHETVAGDDLAAIGYCFGGGVVLTMARMGVDLDGVVSFHGSLASPAKAEPGAVQTRVLVLHGGADQFIPSEQVGAFAEEMAVAGAAWTFVSYPGVLHSFTNPGADALAKEFGLPLAYDAAADRDSWLRMQAFFEEIFSD